MTDMPLTASVDTVFRGFAQNRDRYDLESGSKTFPDIDDDYFWGVYEKWKAYTILSTERVYNLYQATKYIADNRIPGAFVECGVLFGGASIMMALFAEHFGLHDRKHYLFDTFRGWHSRVIETDCKGCPAGLGPIPGFRHIVERNIQNSGLDADRFVLVEGMVQQTLPHPELQSIGVLRLDTDDYQSTLHELHSAYPLVSRSGVLIIDDYGHFKGARQAVDEYFRTVKPIPLLQRIDYSARTAVKIA